MNEYLDAIKDIFTMTNIEPSRRTWLVSMTKTDDAQKLCVGIGYLMGVREMQQKNSYIYCILCDAIGELQEKRRKINE